MKKQISECLSSTGMSEQVERILDNFMLKSVEDSGLEMPNIAGLIASAKECLNSLNYQIPNANYRSHLAINKLGKQKLQRNNQDADKDNRKAARHMAQILSAYCEDISLSVLSLEDSIRGRDTKFFISSESDIKEPLVSMIRGVYGKTETSLIEVHQDFDIQMYAAGRVVFQGKDIEKQDTAKVFDKCEPWVTAVLSSLPENGNYKVAIRFVPITDTKVINEHCSELNQYYCRLRLYGDMNWSNNVSIGNSLNEGTNMIGGMLGIDAAGYNSGYTLTLGSKNIHKEAMLMADQIEHEMNRLIRFGQEALWAVCISVSAQDMDTVQTLTSVLSGTLQEANIKLEWAPTKPRRPVFALNHEILPLMMFPTKEFCGFSFVQNEEFSLLPHHNLDGFRVGHLLWNGTEISSFDLRPEELSRHAFICGMTGSGKTNTLFRILEGIKLPFCVIEPVKGEYRALKDTYPNLQIWTMKVTDDSDTNINIMQMNPFWFPIGGNLAFHIDSLKTIIASSFELTAAMPNILEQCLYNIYVKAGWDLVTSRNVYWGKLPENYLYPTFSDLCNEIEDYLNHSDFSGETMGDYKGALLSRLKSFVGGYKGILLNTNIYPNYEKIMNGQSVIELEGLADDADKCLVMGTVLVQYYEYLKLHFSPSRRKLQHLLIIEEAHRLFKNIKNNHSTDGRPNPTGQLVDSLSNMMAEIRAFGEGMLIVDQSPTKIAEDVIKNSATKIVHRIDNSNDIKALQSALLLPDDILSFTSLAQGEALIRTDGMQKPCKVKILCSNIKEDYNLSASFRKNDATESSLANIFIANSVLNDEKVSELIQEKVITFVNCLTMCGMEPWYSLIGDLLYDILNILRTHKMLNIVDYKMGVLFEIISITIKRIYSRESKHDMGIVHMFVMRLLDFYREQKEGYFIKPKAIEIFQKYLDRNVAHIVKTYCVQYTGKQEHIALCNIAGLDPTDIFSMIVTCYVHDILPAFQYGEASVDADKLICSFLLNSIPFTLQERIVEKYYPVFEKISVYLDSLNNSK